VTVLDANILLYAYGASSLRHKEARVWLEKLLSSAEPVGLPWQSLAAFIRIATNPRLPGFRRSIEEVSRIVDEWLEQPNVRILTPGEDHWRLLQRMMVEGQASGPLVTDAQLAALTIEYGGVLHTTDRDFARFPGLRWKNPLT
jgi:uncharacterized protein